MAVGDVVIHASALRQALTARSIEFLREEDFDRAQELTQLAREVKELEARVERVLGSESPADPSPPPSKEGRSRSESAYPRFHRESDLIVKVALSRNLQTTYEQRCPRAIFEDVLAAIARDVPRGGTFEASQIKSQVSCPDYQVYLILALLEELSYIESPRRGLHRLRGDVGPGWADEVWRAIPRSSGPVA